MQRGWKSPKSALAEGQRIYNNFVKPHDALEGKTPADKVGLKLRDDNKWSELLRNAKDLP